MRPGRRVGSVARNAQTWRRYEIGFVFAHALRALADFRAADGPPSLESGMAGRQCYHCRQWIEDGEAHDCWTTTEAALTEDLSEDLRDAWERLRETAASFGDQRIYASHKSIMFSRTSCYFFVRPKRNVLELCVFLGRTIAAPQVRRVDRASTSKLAHVVHIRHRDEVESPVTDWLREAYELSDVRARSAKPTRAATIGKARQGARKAARSTVKRRSSGRRPRR